MSNVLQIYSQSNNKVVLWRNPGESQKVSCCSILVWLTQHLKRMHKNSLFSTFYDENGILKNCNFASFFSSAEYKIRKGNRRYQTAQSVVSVHAFLYVARAGLQFVILYL